MQAGTLRAEPGPIQRHNHSRSFHDTHHNASNSTPRRGSYAKPETLSHSTAVASANGAVTPGGTAAALKAAQVSSAQYAHVPIKQIATPSPVNPIRNPYMAAASKAWSNSTAKLATSSAPVSRSASTATVPVFIAVQHHVETAPLPSKSPALIASRRVSLELRAEAAEEVAPALAPSQQPQGMPALQPSVFLHPNQVGAPLRGRPSRSQSSDRSVRARSQSAFEGRRSVSHTAHEPLPSSAGSLLAARISFAQDRAMHESSAEGYFGPQSLSLPPPIRSPSANRNRVASGQSSLYAHYTQNKSTSSLPPPPDRPVQTASPGLTVNNAGNTRLSVDGGRAALMAASLSFAHHEQENPRSATPKAEPYAYVTPSQRITLRKEPSNSAKHLAKFLKHGRVQPIPPQDRKRYEGLWAANKGLLLEEAPRFSEEVVNIVVRDIWSRSRLQDEILAQVWQLVDRAGTGRLSKDEFVVGTWLIDHRLRGRKLPNRHELTDDIFAPGPMTRLGIKMPRKLKHDTAKYLDPSVSRKSEKKAQKDAAKKLKREKRERVKMTVA